MNQSSNQSCKLHLQTRNGSTNYCNSTILPVPGFSVDYRSGKYFTDGYVNVKTERFRLWFISWFSVTNGKYLYHGLCDKKKKKKLQKKKQKYKTSISGLVDWFPRLRMISAVLEFTNLQCEDWDACSTWPRLLMWPC